MILHETALSMLPCSVRNIVKETDVKFEILNKDEWRSFITASIFDNQEVNKNSYGELYDLITPDSVTAAFAYHQNIIKLPVTLQHITDVVHEVGHAIDWHLGDKYRYTSSEMFYAEFQRAKYRNTFVSKYASANVNEFFAEGFVAFLNITDNYRKPKLFNRKILKEYAPELEKFFSKLFKM